MGVSLNDKAGASALRVDNLPAGTYTMRTLNTAAESDIAKTGSYGIPADLYTHKLESITVQKGTAGTAGNIGDYNGKTLIVELDGVFR